jgi:DNA-binding transcriptional LysR family regulator
MQWKQRIGHRLKLRDLQILLAVAHAGSMAKAGTQLAVSQPAISKAISAMEHTFGVRLFERSPRGIEPTPYGRALIRRSAAVFDELTQGMKDIEFLSDPTVGEIRIGCTPPLAAGLVTEVIARLSRDYPRITFAHVENDPIPLIRELDQRNVDLVLTRMPEGHTAEHMDVEIFYRDSLVVVAGLQNPWLRRRKVRLADLVDEAWVLLPTGTFIRSAVEEAFAAEGLAPPRRTVVTTSPGMRNSLLATGLFLSTLPATALKFPAGYPAIKALHVELPTTHRPVGLITLRNRSLSPVTQLFVNRTREVVQTIVGRKQLRKSQDKL